MENNYSNNTAMPQQTNNAPEKKSGKSPKIIIILLAVVAFLAASIIGVSVLTKAQRADYNASVSVSGLNVTAEYTQGEKEFSVSFENNTRDSVHITTDGVLLTDVNGNTYLGKVKKLGNVGFIPLKSGKSKTLKIVFDKYDENAVPKSISFTSVTFFDSNVSSAQNNKELVIDFNTANNAASSPASVPVSESASEPASEKQKYYVGEATFENVLHFSVKIPVDSDILEIEITNDSEDNYIISPINEGRKMTKSELFVNDSAEPAYSGLNRIIPPSSHLSLPVIIKVKIPDSYENIESIKITNIKNYTVNGSKPGEVVIPITVVEE